MASELEVGKIVADSGIVGTGTAVVTTAKPTLAITDTSVGGSVTIRGQSPILAFDKEGSGTGTILTDGGGLNIKSGTLDSHGSTHFSIDSTGNVTVEGGDLKIKAPAGNQTDAELLFSSPNNSAYGSTYAIDSKILSTANQSDNQYGSKLKFYTSDNSDTVTERLTIDSSGTSEFNTAGGQLKLTNSGLSGVAIQQLNDGATNSGTLKLQGGTSLVFHTNDDERLSISSTGTATISKPQQETTGTPFSGAALKLLPPSGGTTNTTGVSSIALSTSVTDNYGFLISGHRAGSDGTPTLRVSSHNNSNTGTEVLTISSSGLATFSGGIAQGGTSGDNTAYIDTGGVVYISRASGVGRNMVIFINGGSGVGSITSNTTATQYNTSSDYRLKENLTPLTGALDRIDQLPVYRFNFKADPDTTVDGFVAHEVQAHVPEAITGEKDAMRTVVVQEAVEAVEAVEAQPATYWEEGDELPEGVAVGDEKTAAVEAVEAVEAVAEVTEEQPDYQGIDQSKLVPLLVAAVKELKAKVEALEGGE